MNASTKGLVLSTTGGLLGLMALLAVAQRAAASSPRPSSPKPTTPKPGKPVDLSDEEQAPHENEHAETPSGRTAKQAAKELYDYVVPLVTAGRGSVLGTKGAPNTIVRAAQRDMGQITADGIYGPDTRTRGKALLGVEFPPRELAAKAAKPTTTKPTTTKPATTTTKPAASSASSPAAKPSTSSTGRTAKQAAQELYNYVAPLVAAGKGSVLGTKGAPNTIVQAAQRDMGGITADGIYGPDTRTRGKALLGVEFPPRELAAATKAATPATSKPAALPPPVLPAGPESIPVYQVPVVDTDDEEEEPTPPPPTAAKPAPAVATPATSRTPKQAAQQLYDYVVPLIRNGNGAALGSKGQPNSIVQKAQQDMRIAAADGIYGPTTRARGKELLGREFPAREGTKVAPQPLTQTPAPKVTQPTAAPVVHSELPAPSPVTRSPRQAAEELLEYAKRKGVNLGTKNNPSEEVREAQQDMGITADGIYGPATRTKGKELTGKTFPVRS